VRSDVLEDPGDHAWVGDLGNHPQLCAAQGTFAQVNGEHAFQPCIQVIVARGCDRGSGAVSGSSAWSVGPVGVAAAGIW
jgi:hypothetical protein